MSTITHCTSQRSPDGASFTRRGLLKSAGLGGLSLAAMTRASLEEQIAYASQDVNRSSKPSDLRITDLRIAHIQGAPMRVPIIRIDTNQGISGLARFGTEAVRATLSCSRAVSWRESVQRRTPFQTNQAVWIPRPAGRRRQRRGDGPLGSRRQGVRGPRIPDARRSPPRPDPALCRYDHLARPCGVRAPTEGQARHGLHVPQDGSGHQPARRGTRE